MSDDPVIFRDIKRSEVIAALRESYAALLREEKRKDPSLVSLPDMDAMLDHINEHGLPAGSKIPLADTLEGKRLLTEAAIWQFENAKSFGLNQQSCHGGVAQWKKRDDEPFQRCWYCGSVNPVELLAFLKAGATASCADWKYGWPHKLYIDGIPNPQAGQPVVIGSRPTTNGREDVIGTATKTITTKFYTEHIGEIVDEAVFKELTDIIALQTYVRFAKRDDGKLGWTYTPPAPTPT